MSSKQLGWLFCHHSQIHATFTCRTLYHRVCVGFPQNTYISLNTKSGVTTKDIAFLITPPDGGAVFWKAQTYGEQQAFTLSDIFRLSRTVCRYGRSKFENENWSCNTPTVSIYTSAHKVPRWQSMKFVIHHKCKNLCGRSYKNDEELPYSSRRVTAS